MPDVQFVIAKLIENEIGACYEEEIFDRWLKVELLNGKIITIFDHQLVFDGLTEGEIYEFILVPFHVPRENFRKGLTERNIVVLDIQEILEWQPREPFIIIRPDLLGKTLKIAKTFLGAVVLGLDAETTMYIDNNNQRKLISIRFGLLGVRAVE